MSKNARIWVGVTLLFVLAFNYGLIGLPLYRKAANLNDKATTMMIKKVKSGHALRTSAEEDYILEIFRREKISIDKKLFVLNAVALTLAIIVGSWTAFGLMSNKKR